MKLPLLCELGWHDPRPLARWNHGYYFTTCRRCGVDLVRSGYGRWEAPRGFRVVWRAEAPADAAFAESAGEPAVETGLAGAAPHQLPAEITLSPADHEPLDEWPIRKTRPSAAPPEELAADEPAELVDDDDGEPEVAEESVAAAPVAEAEEVAPKVEPIPASRIGLSKVPDFMGDGSAGHPEPAAPLVPALTDADAAEEAGAPVALEPARRRHDSGREPRPEAPGPIIGETRRVRRRPVGQIAAGVLALAVLLLAAWRWGGDRTSADQDGGNRMAQATTAFRSRPAFVTARVLNGRDAPALQARSVKRLVRGDRVEVFAHDQDWSSIAHEGRQCWSLRRYLSVQRPMDSDGQRG